MTAIVQERNFCKICIITEFLKFTFTNYSFILFAFSKLLPLFICFRNHFLCAVYASRLMVLRQRGLIVTVSSFGGMSYLFNVAYGVGKAACDRLAADIAQELFDKHVTSVSISTDIDKQI